MIGGKLLRRYRSLWLLHQQKGGTGWHVSGALNDVRLEYELAPNYSGWPAVHGRCPRWLAEAAAAAALLRYVVKGAAVAPEADLHR